MKYSLFELLECFIGACCLNVSMYSAVVFIVFLFLRGKGTKNISHTQARGCKGANNYTKKVIFVNFYTSAQIKRPHSITSRGALYSACC